MNTKRAYDVIVVGAGPSGIGAALALYGKGFRSIALIERADRIGGIPELYKKKAGGVRTFMRWSLGGIPVFGEQYAETLRKKIARTDIDVWLKSQVLEIESDAKKLTLVNPVEGQVELEAQAIVLACGSREKSTAERGWITGSRPAGVYYTKQLLQMMDEKGTLPMRKPLIIGSDVIAYAASAKLKVAGASQALIIDDRESPECPFYERVYFKLWASPAFRRLPVSALDIKGTGSVAGVEINNEKIESDGVIVCGDLIPNTELALMGDLKVELPSRRPVLDQHNQLSKPGWFAVGNIAGGFHGAEWCYMNGRKTAKAVARYISEIN